MIIYVLAAGVLVALCVSRLGGRDGDLIVHRPYNNRHNDASGARDDHLS
jgi:hypothetical protein